MPQQDGAVIYYPERPTGYPYPEMPAPQRDDDPLADMRAARAKLEQLKTEKAAGEAAYKQKRKGINITRKPKKDTTSFLDPFVEIMETIEQDKLRTAVDCALSFPAAWKEATHEERLALIEQRKKLVQTGWIPMHAKSWFNTVIEFIADTHEAHLPYQINLIKQARRELLNGDNRDLKNQKSLRECLRVVGGTQEAHKRYTYMGGTQPLLLWLQRTLNVYEGVEHQATRRFVLMRLFNLAPSSCKPGHNRPHKPKAAPAPTQG